MTPSRSTKTRADRAGPWRARQRRRSGRRRHADCDCGERVGRERRDAHRPRERRAPDGERRRLGQLTDPTAVAAFQALATGQSTTEAFTYIMQDGSAVPSSATVTTT